MAGDGADAAATAPTPPLRVSVLGPLLVEHEGRPVEIGPPQRQAVFAALVLRGGRHISTAGLVDWVWGDDPPHKAEAAIRAHVSVLRRVLEPRRASRSPSGVVVSGSSGYAMPPAVASLDAARFRALVAEAESHREQGRPLQAGQALRSGLDLWRGEDALPGIPGPGSASARRVLEEERLTAWEDYLDGELSRRGLERPVHSALIRALANRPHRERLHGLLVRAFWRQGRRAEALAAYASARDVLLADLGVEPGAALQELHRRLVADEPLEPEAGRAAVPAPPAEEEPDRSSGGPSFVDAMGPTVGVEAEPPPTVFARDHAGPLPRCPPLLGRGVTVGMVAEALREARDGLHAGTVLVRGLPGIGTSAVALAGARAAIEAFPGGGVVLGREASDRAWTQALTELDPREACLLVVDGCREPEDGVRAMRARDDLHTAGAEDVVVLTTGTHRLPRVRGRRIEVAPLDEAESTTLFARALGDRRAETERAAVAVIVGLHSGFPQILEATAGVLASRPSWSLTDWVNDLMVRQGSWSSLQRHGLGLFFTPHYDALDVAEATVFRAGGLHPFAPLTVDVLGAMLAVPADRVMFLLERLHDRGLLESPRPAEYLMPFLLWNYARIVGLADDDPAVRAGQADRMLAWYRDRLAERAEVLATGFDVEAAGWVDKHRGALESLRHEYAGHPTGRAVSDLLDATDAVRQAGRAD
ncbi:BTAD domain-containing putative transcriptional regulator [Actinomycetospora sp. NBRC 106378]|uniref:BTAD domain-containing putative transcriptional regulator n=1 Tax=Actinomycetospora sp. NBRC 106378 TaxID=3032208 RepID=UPI0025537E69|nr:BTAD domain-containing putative transcriptional regulator [Actinomycetospora sp. NBRC 106378]